MSDLRALVSAELAEPVDPVVTAMAAAIAAQYGSAARAVLFYGSCLRQQELDGLMLDFYLIVSDYEAAWPGSWLATANRLVPPNVFPFAHAGLAAKYAVLSESDFAALNGPAATTVSVWARFAQPSRLVWAADSEAEKSVIDAIIEAPNTLFQLTLPVLAVGTQPHAILEIWKAGFARTYRAELRAERTDRSANIVDVDPERYERFGQATLGSIAQRLGVGPGGEVPLIAHSKAMDRRWRALQRHGKLMSVVRLAKASFTFAGGVDYLAWKINRHAGTQIAIKPWQRRWPLLGAIVLVPRLLLQGAVR